MSEAAAIEKIDNLIIESQSADAETDNSPSLLFPLDQSEIVRELEFVYGDDEDSKIILYHKLKWPTLDALIKRQQQIPYRSEVLSPGLIRSQNDDGVTANALLWDEFRSQVKGYEWGGINPNEWVDVSDDLAAEIPSEHKSEAIVGLFASEFEIEHPKSKGFVLGAQTYKVKQTYGPYVIWHIFSKPSDRDRRTIARKSRETRNRPGATKAKTEIFTNLKPYADVYDGLFDRLEGVTGADPNIAKRKDLVNGLWKRGAIDALMDSFEAQRRDLSKS